MSKGNQQFVYRVLWTRNFPTFVVRIEDILICVAKGELICYGWPFAVPIVKPFRAIGR